MLEKVTAWCWVKPLVTGVADEICPAHGKSESTGRDWFIQAGSLDMFVTGDSKNAFMVDGSDDDSEWRFAA
ncbi:MAG: hypothetical protein B7X93_11825 [Hydrogenophilales bacterium 17-61-9]|nr:MAG: hypothetical protein B7X93_11825 [Hydrogenophilales bacterium 17-61-9]